MIVTARKLNLYCYTCLSIHSRREGEGEEKEEGKMKKRRRRREEEEEGKSG